MDDFPPLPPPGLVAPVVPENALVVLDEMPLAVAAPVDALAMPVVGAALEDAQAVPDVGAALEDAQAVPDVGAVPENAPVAPGPGAMVQFQAVFDNLSDEESVHTNDMYVNAPPGTLTRLRQDFAIMDAGGTIRDHSHTQSESSSSIGVSIDNHPEIIKANRFKLDYVNFLKSKGLLDDFNAYQSSLSNLHARKVDDNGVIRPTLTSVARDFCVRQGILCVGNSNPDVGTSAPVAPKDAKTWSSIVAPLVPQNDSSAPEPSLSYNVDGSANLSPPKSFLLAGRKRWATSCIGYFVGGGFSFKFVKENALKMWKNRGLLNVYFNSKGYYTFEFKTEDEMKSFLGASSMMMGGKRMYLGAWIEGTNFQRNVIPFVSIWVQFSDVPHSYWTAEGIRMLARAVGKPITLDAPTAKLEPMRYARVLVEVSYKSPKPDFIWVPVISDEDGSIVKVKVQVLYSAMPLSCSLCACYGHSLARCTKNPNKVKDPSSDKGSTKAPPAHHGAPNSDTPKGTTRAPPEHTELQQTLAQNENVQLDDVEMIQHMADIITDLARDMAYTQVEHITPDSVPVQTPVPENAPVAPEGILESVPLDAAFADQEQINSPNRFQALADVDDDVMIDNTGIQNSYAHGPNVVVFGLAAPGGAMALPPLPPALEEGEFTPASKGKKKQRSKVQQASPSKRGLGNGDKGSTLPKRSRRLQGDATKASQ